MTILQIELDGEVTVVTSDRVEALTQRGWIVRAIVKEIEVVWVDSKGTERAHSGQDYNDGYHNGRTPAASIPWTRREIEVAKFVLIRGRDKSFAELKDAYNALEKEHCRSISALESAHTAKKNLEAKLAAEQDLRKRKDEICQEVRGRNHHYERDIAKLREVLGTARFNEILGKTT